MPPTEEFQKVVSGFSLLRRDRFVLQVHTLVHTLVRLNTRAWKGPTTPLTSPRKDYGYVCVYSEKENYTWFL